jgi:N-acetylmuramic acid 6-phosphate (MurNAc-6-P) etherase
MKYQTKFINIMHEVKRTFSSAVRQPYQDAIGIILKIIDYHNEQARKDFGNSEFHSKQATVLKLWMIDMKEFITKHEKKESISIQATKEKTGREKVLSSIDENV